MTTFTMHGGMREFAQFKPVVIKDTLEDALAHKIFTNGHCHSFAVAVHDLTGWEVYGLLDKDSTVPGHIIVKSPEGWFDVGGLDAKARWEKRWGFCEARPEQQLWRVRNGSKRHKKRQYLPGQVQDAMLFAKLALEKHFPGLRFPWQQELYR